MYWTKGCLGDKKNSGIDHVIALSLPSLLQAHVKAQLSKKTQLLAIMSRKHQELESRLDEMITRIHKETQEIKELEQQLTDGEKLF